MSLRIVGLILVRCQGVKLTEKYQKKSGNGQTKNKHKREVVMNEIIKVIPDGFNGGPGVSARELYEQLGIQKQFTNWFDQAARGLVVRINLCTYEVHYRFEGSKRIFAEEDLDEVNLIRQLLDHPTISGNKTALARRIGCNRKTIQRALSLGDEDKRNGMTRKNIKNLLGVYRELIPKPETRT